MKTLALAVTASALIALAGGQAFAKPVHVQKTAKLTIVMHDPGCHWFSIGGKFKTTASVAGPVKLTNHDEATLKVSGVVAVKKIPVGKQLLLGTGHYVITMVGQAPDDNHLKLTVS